MTDAKRRPPERSAPAEPDHDAEPDPAELDATERARIARRDRDAAAEERKLMNSGSAKWFKQVLDHQAKQAREPGPRKRR